MKYESFCQSVSVEIKTGHNLLLLQIWYRHTSCNLTYSHNLLLCRTSLYWLKEPYRTSLYWLKEPYRTSLYWLKEPYRTSLYWLKEPYIFVYLYKGSFDTVVFNCKSRKLRPRVQFWFSGQRIMSKTRALHVGANTLLFTKCQSFCKKITMTTTTMQTTPRP